MTGDSSSSPGGPGGRWSKRPLDLFHPERLDAITDLEIIEVLDTDSALETLADLADVILEAFETGQGAGIDRRTVTGNPRLGCPLNGAAPDHAACDGAHFAHLEQLEH